jgi:hypothetical protein
MSKQSNLISQGIQITAGTLIIQKPLFGDIINRETIGRKISWNPEDFKISTAFLRVKADQDVNSGASLTVNHNDRRLDPVIRWEALDTKEKSLIYNVTSLLTNGENIFDFVYEVSGLHQQAASCKVDAFMSVDFEPISGKVDDTPAEQGKATDKLSWDKFTKAFSENLKMIVTIMILGTIGGILSYLYLKKNTLLLKLLGKVSRR